MSDLPKTLKTRREIFLNAIATGQVGDLPTPVTREEAYLKYIAENGSGGGGGTSDYEELNNKPQINGVPLIGNKTTEDLNIASLEMTPITYSELVTLRANSGLVAGKYYRITDYVTTTVQAETQSAGNVFDVIVRADSDSVLNENAYAIQHEGDTYFEGQHLGAWELKYSLDNDTERFAWADSTNGKGVIYFMRDEYGNECGYDFKNIQMKFYEVSRVYSGDNPKYHDVSGYFLGSKQVGQNNQALNWAAVDTSSFLFLYTFSYHSGSTTENPTDYSLNKNNDKVQCYNNKISSLFGGWVLGNSEKMQYINFVCLCVSSRSSACHDNSFGGRNYNNILSAYTGGSIQGNKFGNGCYANVLDFDVISNTLGDECTQNYLSVPKHNIIGDNFSQNSFAGIVSNVFGNYCQQNGGNIDYTGDMFYNHFGNYCVCNKLGGGCSFNIFDTGSSWNILGESCNNYKINFSNTPVMLNFGMHNDYSGNFIETVYFDAENNPYVEFPVYNDYAEQITVTFSVNFILNYADEETGLITRYKTYATTESVTINGEDTETVTITSPQLATEDANFDGCRVYAVAQYQNGNTTITTCGFDA